MVSPSARRRFLDPIYNRMRKLTSADCTKPAVTIAARRLSLQNALMNRIASFFEQMSTRRVGSCLRKDMQALGIRLPRPTVSFSGSSPSSYDCEFSRHGARYTLNFNGDLTDPNVARVTSERAGAFAYWLWHCPQDLGSITVNMSDGDHPSDARFAMSVREPHVVPLPDAFFFAHRGYRHYRTQAEEDSVPWHARSGKLRWRGTTSGRGHADDFSPEAVWNPQVLPRIRMALLLRDQPNCDVAFAGSNRGSAHADRLREHRLLGDPIPEFDWIDDKFALDIDGHANTWSNFLVRLHLGCCVIKVDSQGGYRQWYYDRIRPWEHFVPVKADMTDLVEKIEWARFNDAEAKAIAANGQAFARTMTFESETEWAVAAICTAKGVSPI